MKNYSMLKLVVPVCLSLVLFICLTAAGKKDPGQPTTKFTEDRTGNGLPGSVKKTMTNMFTTTVFTFGRADYPAPPGVSVSNINPVTIQFLQNNTVVRTVALPASGNSSETIASGTYNIKFTLPYTLGYPVYFYVRSTSAPLNIDYWYRLFNTTTYTTPALTVDGGSIAIDLTNTAL